MIIYYSSPSEWIQWIFQTVFEKTLFFVICDNWSICPIISVIRQCTVISLNSWNQNREILSSPCTGLWAVALQCCARLPTSLPRHSPPACVMLPDPLKVHAQVWSGLFWVYIGFSACVLHSGFHGLYVAFLSLFPLRTFSLLIPGHWDLAGILPIHCPLLQKDIISPCLWIFGQMLSVPAWQENKIEVTLYTGVLGNCQGDENTWPHYFKNKTAVFIWAAIITYHRLVL